MNDTTDTKHKSNGKEPAAVRWLISGRPARLAAREKSWIGI